MGLHEKEKPTFGQDLQMTIGQFQNRQSGRTMRTLLRAIIAADEGQQVMVIGATFEQARNHLFKRAREIVEMLGIPHKANRIGGVLEFNSGGTITVICSKAKKNGSYPIRKYDNTLHDHYAVEYEINKGRRWKE